jgi:ATP-dependent Clp protease adaptor protein ClpS
MEMMQRLPQASGFIQPVNAAEAPSPQTPSGGQLAEPPVERSEGQKPNPAKVDFLPRFKVLLHNDDVNDVEWVVRSIIALTPTPPLRAIEITMEAHESGVALLLVTHKERAELYQEQFLTKKLTVTIEPAE